LTTPLVYTGGMELERKQCFAVVDIT